MICLVWHHKRVAISTLDYSPLGLVCGALARFIWSRCWLGFIWGSLLVSYMKDVRLELPINVDLEDIKMREKEEKRKEKGKMKE